MAALAYDKRARELGRSELNFPEGGESIDDGAGGDGGSGNDEEEEAKEALEDSAGCMSDGVVGFVLEESSLVELRELCRFVGLPVGGNKADLVKRIEQMDKSQSAECVDGCLTIILDKCSGYQLKDLRNDN